MSDIVILGGARTAIVPVEVKVKRDLVGFDTDEHPKPTTLEGLGKLRPPLKKTAR